MAALHGMGPVCGRAQHGEVPGRDQVGQRKKGARHSIPCKSIWHRE